MIRTRANIIRNPQAKFAWLMTLSIAASCCWYPGCCKVNCDIHHIIGAAARSDEAANLALLCREHHDAYHAGRIKLAQMLWLKKTLDPANWHPRRLRNIRGQALPRLEPML